MAKLSAGTLATEGFRLMAREKGAVAVWGAIYLLLLLASTGGLLGLLAPLMKSLLIPGRAPDPATAAAVLKPIAVLYGLLLPLAFAAQAVLTCAIYRAVLRPQDRRGFYLRVGGDEGRVLLTSIVLALIAAVAIFVVVAAVAGATAAVAGDGGKLLTGFIGGIAGFCALAYLGGRLCLATPMTFAERRVRVFGSWRLTRGRVWTLLAAFLLAMALIVVVGSVMQIVLGIVMTLSSGGLATLAQGGPVSPSALVGLLPAAAAYMLAAAAMSLVQTIIALTPLAAAYREIVGDPVALADTFA